MPRVRSHCRFRNGGTEYISYSAMVYEQSHRLQSSSATVRAPVVPRGAHGAESVISSQSSARMVSGWPQIRRLGRAFLWECSCERLKGVGQASGPTCSCLAHVSRPCWPRRPAAAGSRRRPPRRRCARPPARPRRPPPTPAGSGRCLVAAAGRRASGSSDPSDSYRLRPLRLRPRFVYFVWAIASGIHEATSETPLNGPAARGYGVALPAHDPEPAVERAWPRAAEPSHSATQTPPRSVRLSHA
jgi:hypothetical protein